MAEATNAQMQRFADERVRPFAEALRLLFNQATDHLAAITDVTQRANGTNGWADARTDGPPHLLQSGNSVSPDDMKKFRSLLQGLGKFQTGTFATLAEANAFAADWQRVVDACVRPVGA